MCYAEVNSVSTPPPLVDDAAKMRACVVACVVACAVRLCVCAPGGMMLQPL